MNKKTLIIVLTISLPLVFFAGFKCQQTLSSLDEIGKPQLSTIKLEVKNSYPLYFVKKNWGYTGDHQIIALTTREPDGDNWIADELSDYIWEGEILIYYQQKGDTLKIWSNYLPNITKKDSINQVIQFKEIKGTMFNILKQQVDTSIKIVK